MAVAEALREDIVLQACAFESPEDRVSGILRRELEERLGGVTLIRHRWELRPCFRSADVVLWYGVVPAVADVLASLAVQGRRPGSVRVVHTSREEDGPAFHRRWRQVIDRTVCVHPGGARRIPGAVFVPNTCSPDRLQGHRLEPSSNLPTLGFLGRLVPQKNVAWLVENLEALGASLLLQVFDTPFQTAADLAGLAERCGVAGRVCFLPPGREVGTLLRSVDALVIASQHEGFPMVAVEAGLLGTPVISTRVGALPELFSEEMLFVDSREGFPDLASMQNALAKLRAVPGPVWGRRLQERVATLCARERVVASYRDVLRSVCERQTSGTAISASGPR